MNKGELIDAVAQAQDSLKQMLDEPLTQLHQQLLVNLQAVDLVH